VLENAFRGLSFPHRQHLYSIEAYLFLLLLFEGLLGLLEGLDDRFVVISVVGVSGDSCKFSTTSSKFWLICSGTSLILMVGASGMATGEAAAGTGFCL
jgi:hypothetical protein